MGLDTTHGAWTGPYSSFNRWRDEVARVAGVSVNWGKITHANLDGKWEKTPSEPLLVLLAHYDCDGYIAPEQATPLADRLEEIAPKLSDDAFYSHRDHALRFAAGLRNAAALNEPVEFR